MESFSLRTGIFSLRNGILSLRNGNFQIRHGTNSEKLQKNIEKMKNHNKNNKKECQEDNQITCSSFALRYRWRKDDDEDDESFWQILKQSTASKRTIKSKTKTNKRSYPHDFLII